MNTRHLWRLLRCSEISCRSGITRIQHRLRHQMSHFDPNAILRGAQLTVVGAFRALQNPSLLTSRHYKQVAIAIACGIAIRIIISIPVYIVQVLLWLLSFVLNVDYITTWTQSIISSLGYVQDYVLQVPFFLMILMRYLTPTLDNMFMESLAWVDRTYYQKHRGEDSTVLRKGYYENLSKYSTGKIKTQPKNNPNAIKKLLIRSVKSAGISLLIFTLSYLPVVGRFVLPTVSFYTFQKVTGFAPAAVIFGTSIFLPRKFLVIFLQSYFASRKLVRELLEPYFCRIRFNKEQKRNWFRDREGLLFGFGLGFYLFLRIPFFGVLIYGIAEASTAYLITKITDPPPPPDRCEGFAAGQQHWTNKVGFLKLNLGEIDQLTHRRQTTSQSEQRAFSSADLHATLNRGLSYVF